MSVLTLYILRQIITPLIIATLTLSGIIWMLRAVRLLDTVIISGQSLTVWLELLVYTMPSVLAVVLPPAFLIAVFYAFYRLFMDREIIIMFVTGVARTRLIRPVLVLSVFVAALVLALGFYAAPWSHQMLKQRSLEINSDITNAMLQPGVFTNPAKGITAFIRARDEKGFIYGIFFQDERKPDKPVSYTAESGALVYNNGQTNLLMFNGHIQHYDKQSPNAGITLVKFDRYSYDLAQLVQINASKSLRAREFFPEELYKEWFDPKASPALKKDIFLFANNLILKAFYIIAYGFIVLAVFLSAQVNRQGYTKRIIVAVLAALTLSFSHFPILTYAYDNIFFFALLYLNPVIASAIALFICLKGVGVLGRIKHRIATNRLPPPPPPPSPLPNLDVV